MQATQCYASVSTTLAATVASSEAASAAVTAFIDASTSVEAASTSVFAVATVAAASAADAVNPAKKIYALKPSISDLMPSSQHGICVYMLLKESLLL